MKKLVGEIELEHVYTDAKGLRWWQYANQLQFPRTRQLLAQRFAFGAAIGLELKVVSDSVEKSLSLYSEAMQAKAAKNEHLQEQKEVECTETLLYLHERIGYVTSDESILAHAAVYYVLDGEKAEHYDTEYAAKKREILIADDAARDFFLSKAKKEVSSLRERYKQDFQNSLNKTADNDLTPAQKASAYKLPS